MAKRHAVECHGTLWVLDALVDRGVLKKSRAADAVRAMLAGGHWLPRIECDVRIGKWDL